MLMKGKVILRGYDWKWQDQDGGEGNVGKVVDVSKNGMTVRVQWPSGHMNMYRSGAESGKYDLATVDSAQAGINHETVRCNECVAAFPQSSHVQGIRWKCANCDDFDLCNKCYMTGKHNTTHAFRRYDFYHSLGCFVPRRENSRTVTLKGSDLPFTSVYIDHLEKLGAPHRLYVVRGPDWKWSEQDTGEGNVGIVTENKRSERGLWLAAAWIPAKESKNIYRAGADKKKDLRMLDTRMIGCEHRDHSCSSCGEKPILGMRWQCSECTSVHLCSNCYMSDKHETSHAFFRFISQSDKGVKCLARDGSATVALKNKPAFYTANQYYVKHLPDLAIWDRTAIFEPGTGTGTKFKSSEDTTVIDVVEDGGQVTLGTFTIMSTMKDRIGQGQFGVVYRGFCRKAKTPVAVKEIPVDSHKTKQQAMDEIQNLQAFEKHDHLVSLLNYGLMQNSYWIVMEYCNLGDLQTYCKEQKPMEPVRLEFLVHIANAIDFIHRRDNPLVHMDIKPANILVHFNETDRPILKVADFGLAKIIHNADERKTAWLTAKVKAGTPYFMAPEVCACETHITPSVDIFAAGLVFNAILDLEKNVWDMHPNVLKDQLYSCLSLGQYLQILPPDQPPSLEKVIQSHQGESEHVAHIKALIRQMLQKDRKNRPNANFVLVEVQGVFASVIDDLGNPPQKPTVEIPSDLPSYKKPNNADDESDSEDEGLKSDDSSSSSDSGDLGQLLRQLRDRAADGGLGGADGIGSELIGLQSLLRGALGLSDSDEELDDGSLKEGDRVRIDSDQEKVKRMQDDHGGYVSSMAQYCGEVGEVDKLLKLLHHVFRVYVKFSDGQRFQYNPDLLTKVDKTEPLTSPKVTPMAEVVGKMFKRFDVVKIHEEPTVLEALQKGHGGWDPKMKLACGFKGLVNKIDSDGDVYVECINGHDWWINPESLVKVSPEDGTIEPGDFVLVSEDKSKVQELQKGHGEWSQDMDTALGHTGIAIQLLPGGRIRAQVGHHKWIFNIKVLTLVAKSEEMQAAMVMKRSEGG